MRHASVVANLSICPIGHMPINEAQAREPRPVTIRPDGVSQYLLGLAALCVEVARNPRLLPVFLRIVARVPRTIESLRSRRLAA